MIAAKLKLVLIVILILFIAFVIIKTKINASQCKEDQVEILKHLDYLDKSKSDSISSIVLSKSTGEWQVNLVSDDIVITKRNQIDSIKKMLTERHIDTSSHPLRNWSVLITINYVSKRKFTFEVMGVLFEGSSSNSVILKFNKGFCQEAVRQSSNSLGYYLENLTNYRGVKY